jgi:transcriptional regulator with XRE-family HTH domain
MLVNGEYDAATVALRVLRLVTVASIFAFVLTVRTVAPIHATDDPAGGLSPIVDIPGTDPIEPVPSEPPPADPVDPEPSPSDPPSEDVPLPGDPVEPAPSDPPPADTVDPEPSPSEPPAEVVPAPGDTVEPAPSDPPPADTIDAELPPSEPPAEEVPPGEIVEPAPTDPPPADPPPADPPPVDPVDAEVPPSDLPIEEVPLPGDTIEPAPSDPPPADSTLPIGPDASLPIGDPVAAHPYAAEPAPAAPSAHQTTVHVPPAAETAAQETAPVTPIAGTLANRLDGASDVPTRATGLDTMVAAGAGLAAGLVITNHAPGSVAVALEFGRAGSGWAGALVFNLWLRRQLRERRMSQRQLAALSGVDHSTISRLLRQDRRPSLITATKLAGALKQLRGEQAEPEAAAYFERIPEETVFPARRVELALRADEMLDDEQVRRLMYMYLDARRQSQANAPPGSARSRAAPARAAPARAGRDAS